MPSHHKLHRLLLRKVVELEKHSGHNIVKPLDICDCNEIPEDSILQVSKKAGFKRGDKLTFKRGSKIKFI